MTPTITASMLFAGNWFVPECSSQSALHSALQVLRVTGKHAGTQLARSLPISVVDVTLGCRRALLDATQQCRVAVANAKERIALPVQREVDELLVEVERIAIELPRLASEREDAARGVNRWRRQPPGRAMWFASA